MASVDGLAVAWTAPDHTGALVANGRWYAEGPTGDLEVLALDGSSCPGGSCTPQWSAEGRPVALSADHVITLVDEGAGAFRLHATDRAGVDGCTGAPRVCAPQWRSPVIGEPVDGTARVLGDHLVVAEATGVADPYGGVGPARLLGWRDVGAPARCGEVTPGVCPHDWQSGPLTLFDAADTFDPERGAVALGVGHAVVVDGAGLTTTLRGFDLAGAGCVGSAPATCSSTWQASSAISSLWAEWKPYVSPVIAGGRVYVVEGWASLFAPDKLRSWDIAGCAAASPCAATWSRTLGDDPGIVAPPGDPLDRRYSPSDPTVVGSTVLIHRSLESWSEPAEFPRQDWVLALSTAPGDTTAEPRWRTPGVRPTHGLVVGGGVAFVEPPTGGIAAVDASGTVGCAGAPKVCAPLWSSTEATAVRSVVGRRVLADAVGGGTVVFST